jgi:alcohol dehydrogenase
MMRHYVQTGYGPMRDTVALVEAADPVLGAGEILVDVRAASLNPIDYKIVLGALKMVQTLHFPSAMGFDGSGVVAAIGAGVTAFKPGDAVFFRAPRDRRGSFAQRFVIEARYAATKPEALSHAEAASLPLVSLTTVQGVLDRAKAKPGQSILIHAGSGGVGSFAVQYAKALGLHVTATCSSRNVDMVKALGADQVIAYDQADYRTRPDRYDIVYDTLGGDVTVDAFAVAKPGGSVISIAGPPTAEMAEQLGVGLLLRLAMRVMRRKVMAASARTGVAYFGYFTESDGAQLDDIGKMAATGAIKPVIDRSFPFENLVEALDYLETGHARGKVILDVG